MSLSFCVASHTGVRRPNNEDSCCVRPDLGLFVVADGVGGNAAGEVASQAAVKAIEQAVADTTTHTEHSPWPFDYQPALGVDGNRLNWAFHVANGRLRIEAEAGRGRQGMATTVVAVLLERSYAKDTAESPTGPRYQSEPAFLIPPTSEPTRGATIAHIGDSRIYRYRAGRLDRLTRDHSWVEEQVQAGLLSERDARAHPRRNLLTRALAGGVDPMADLGWVALSPGDSLLLCSDGLSSVLTDDQIAEILARNDPGGSGSKLTTESVGARTTSKACEALVHAANLAGGPDNITVILIRL